MTAAQSGFGCCTPGGASTPCCGAGSCTDVADRTIPSRRRLLIEFMYIDLSVCTRCKGTDSSLEEAISEVAQVLKATGVEVDVRKTLVETEEQAAELKFVSSPTIRVNGKDIQMDVRETPCESCGDVCGQDVDCRVWTYQGEEYNVPPKALIIEAILREIYSGAAEAPAPVLGTFTVPENLKSFFAAKRRSASGAE